MKNAILLFLLFAVSLTAFAQRSLGYYDYETENFFRVGFNAGLYINKIQGKSFENAYSYNYGFRGFMQFNFHRKLGIQPEISYSQGSAEQSDDYSDIWDDISLGGRQSKVKLDYLKFGTMLNYNLGLTTRIKLQFGPQWGMLMSEKIDSLKTPQDIFKKSDFSLAGGIMFQLPFVHFGGRFEQGLTNINAIDNRDKWKNQSFQLFAGLTF